MLELKFNDSAGQTVADIPNVDRPITVGRAFDVDVSLPYKAISRHHARFFPQGNLIYVEDLGSSNGVFVAGQRISSATALNVGDDVRIGGISVIITNPAGPLTLFPQEHFHSVTDRMRSQIKSTPHYLVYSQSTSPPSVASRITQPGLSGYSPEIKLRKQSQQVGVFGELTGRNEPNTLANYPPIDYSQTEIELESNPEASTSPTSLVPRLVGESEANKDQVVFLDRPKLKIGRLRGNGLMIGDVSVSRKHATILRREETFVLYDLNSFNGTYINGKQISKAELHEGDHIAFAHVAYRFFVANKKLELPPKKKATSRVRVLGILIGTAIVLALLVLSAFFLQNSTVVTPPPNLDEQERLLKAKIRQQLDRGFAELQRRDWETASATLQEVLKLDPLNDDAVDGLEIARSERERSRWIQEAHRVAQAGHDLEQAQRLLEKIPQKSAYYDIARFKLQQVNRTLAEKALYQGLSDCRALRFVECHRELCHVFQTWPPGEPIPDEDDVRRALKRTETILKRQKGTGFVPCHIPELDVLGGSSEPFPGQARARSPRSVHSST